MRHPGGISERVGQKSTRTKVYSMSASKPSDARYLRRLENQKFSVSPTIPEVEDVRVESMPPPLLHLPILLLREFLFVNIFVEREKGKSCCPF